MEKGEKQLIVEKSKFPDSEGKYIYYGYIIKQNMVNVGEEFSRVQRKNVLKRS